MNGMSRKIIRYFQGIKSYVLVVVLTENLIHARANNKLHAYLKYYINMGMIHTKINCN